MVRSSKRHGTLSRNVARAWQWHVLDAEGPVGFLSALLCVVHASPLCGRHTSHFQHTGGQAPCWSCMHTGRSMLRCRHLHSASIAERSASLSSERAAPSLVQASHLISLRNCLGVHHRPMPGGRRQRQVDAPAAMMAPAGRTSPGKYFSSVFVFAASAIALGGGTAFASHHTLIPLFGLLIWFLLPFAHLGGGPSPLSGGGPSIVADAVIKELRRVEKDKVRTTGSKTLEFGSEDQPCQDVACEKKGT